MFRHNMPIRLFVSYRGKLETPERKIPVVSSHFHFQSQKQVMKLTVFPRTEVY